MSKGPTEKTARTQVLETARAMSRRGLSPGRSGNVSCRFTHAKHGAGMLITPSGKAYDETEPSDIVFVAMDGSVPPGQLKPSSEWHFHAAAYRVRADRHALVHTHAMHATVLACAHRPIPAFHYMVALAGGNDIPCVPYATFGTEDLARQVAKGVKSRDAILMANHGQIAMGETLASALELAFEVEVLAEQYCKLLSLGAGAVHVLPDDEMRRMVEKFKTYGQKGQS